MHDHGRRRDAGALDQRRDCHAKATRARSPRPSRSRCAPTSGQTVTVQYATADGTAVASSTTRRSGDTAHVRPGETTKTITVPVSGDTLDEPNETFLVNLSSAGERDPHRRPGPRHDHERRRGSAATAATTASAAPATTATAPATSACASDDRSQALRAGQGRSAEVGADAPVASGGACPSLQRPGLPQRAQDLHRVADEAAAEAQGALEVPGPHVPAQARHLHVDRLAERGRART